MRFAFINGTRQEPQPGLQAECPGCSRPMIAKCGKIKVWHWAHREKLVCDPWWENETEWHRDWKKHFPDDWQEIIHHAESGERHIADVKTNKDWVLEFQHSPLDPNERQARNSFYKKLIWVVDGTTRKRDKAKFLNALREVNSVTNPQSPFRRIFKVLPNECALLRDWADGPVPVFFDFGKEEQMLWCLFPKNSYGDLYVVEFFRRGLVVFHRNEVIEKDFFSDLINNFKNTLSQLSAQLQAQRQNQHSLNVFPRRFVRRIRPSRHL